jgi:hypothetical protein
MGDQPVTRPLPTCRTIQKQNKLRQTSMPRVGFQPTIPVFKRVKMVHALDRAATVIDFSSSHLPKSSVTTNTIQQSPCWCLPFMEPNVSLLCSLQLAAHTQCELNNSSRQPATLFLPRIHHANNTEHTMPPQCVHPFLHNLENRNDF